MLHTRPLGANSPVADNLPIERISKRYGVRAGTHPGKGYVIAYSKDTLPVL